MLDVQYKPTIRDGFEDEHSSLLKEVRMLQELKITSYAVIYFLVFGFSFIALQVTTEEVKAATGVCELIERIRNMKDTQVMSCGKERYQIPRWSRVEDGGIGSVEESECNKNTSEWPLGQV